MERSRLGQQCSITLFPSPKRSSSQSSQNLPPSLDVLLPAHPERRWQHRWTLLPTQPGPGALDTEPFSPPLSLGDSRSCDIPAAGAFTKETRPGRHRWRCLCSQGKLLVTRETSQAPGSAAQSRAKPQQRFGARGGDRTRTQGSRTRGITRTDSPVLLSTCPVSPVGPWALRSENLRCPGTHTIVPVNECLLVGQYSQLRTGTDPRAPMVQASHETPPTPSPPSHPVGTRAKVAQRRRPQEQRQVQPHSRASCPQLFLLPGWESQTGKSILAGPAGSKRAPPC